MENKKLLYRCARCRANLALLDSGAICEKCSKVYPIEDNVVLFSGELNEKHVPAAGEIKKRDLANFITALKKEKDKKWQTLLIKTFSRENYYVTDYTRADFKPLLPISRDAVFLEIGSSWGQIVLNIAPSVKEAWALEVFKDQCIINALVAEREGINNVYIACGGGRGFLPYKNNSFDIIVMNNVIEWIGARAYPEKPLEVQTRICQEAERVLKPGGVFFIATKNRFALQYIMGGKDEHLNMRFGSALPRAFVNWLASRKKIIVTVHVHSIKSLIALLKGVNIKITDIYWAIPDVRKPEYYVPLTNEMIKYVRSNKSIRSCLPRKYRLAIKIFPAFIFKCLIYNFVLLGKKNEA